MKKIQTVLFVAVLGIMSLAIPVQPAYALECSVLPGDLCDAADPENKENLKVEDTGIWKLLIFVINILTAGVGIVAVGAIAFAGFLYSTAQSNPSQTQKAIEIIRNTVIGLIVYAFMFVGINFLIPGGIFNVPGSGSGGGGGATPVKAK
jgi:magnesium-transporting ATPase (P-type)